MFIKEFTLEAPCTEESEQGYQQYVPHQPYVKPYCMLCPGFSWNRHTHINKQLAFSLIHALKESVEFWQCESSYYYFYLNNMYYTGSSFLYFKSLISGCYIHFPFIIHVSYTFSYGYKESQLFNFQGLFNKLLSKFYSCYITPTCKCMYQKSNRLILLIFLLFFCYLLYNNRQLLLLWFFHFSPIPYEFTEVKVH